MSGNTPSVPALLSAFLTLFVIFSLCLFVSFSLSPSVPGTPTPSRFCSPFPSRAGNHALAPFPYEQDEPPNRGVLQCKVLSAMTAMT